jgi:hypothetical protein
MCAGNAEKYTVIAIKVMNKQNHFRFVSASIHSDRLYVVLWDVKMPQTLFQSIWRQIASFRLGSD